MFKALANAVTELPSKLAAWNKARLKRKSADRYEEGYRAGMEILCSQKMTPERLYRCTEESLDRKRFTEFDVGIRSAIFDFENSGPGTRLKGN